MTTLWERVKTGSKTGFDKTWKVLDKVGAPVNKLSNKLGSEAFWPTTLDKECDKAARILKSFCTDGFYAEEEYQPQDGPKQKQRVVKKIPAKVVQNAKALAIFTTMRTGLWFSGAGGSGILIARKEDGSWSPPSGILLHTAGLGFMVGIDIYDCVVVINTEKALEAFYKIRCTLGSEISVAAGPVGAGGVLETELHKRQAPVFTYMKSRGFYAGVQIDGTVILERADENERFYGQRIPVKDILGGKVRHPPFEVRRLLETIKAAQGDNNFDETALPSEPPPGDYEIDDCHVFGVPDKEDPDPYGVLALEKEGMKVVEAGTQERASWEQFSFSPSPTSPVHSIYNRNSVDYRRSLSHRSSWRGSLASATTTTQTRPSSFRQSLEAPAKSTMVDSSTQTEVSDEPQSPVLNSLRNSFSRHNSTPTSISQQMQNVPEHAILQVNISEAQTKTGYTTPPTTPPYDKDEQEDGPEDDVEIVQPTVQSVQSVKAATTPVVSKARLVTVAKRAPPKLPPRNPSRAKTNDSPVSRASEDSSAPVHDMEPLSELASLHSNTSPVARPLSGVSSIPEHPIATASLLEMPPVSISHEEDSNAAEKELPPPEKAPDTDLLAATSTFDEINLHDTTVEPTKRFSTLSSGSNTSSTWDKVRALRSIEDDD